jgi:hypothetical protein
MAEFISLTFFVTKKTPLKLECTAHFNVPPTELFIVSSYALKARHFAK